MIVLSATCPTIEYGDSFDVMGSAYSNDAILLSSYSLSQIGIVGPRNTLTANAADKTYSVKNLTTMKTVGSRKVLLTVPTSDPLRNLYIDYKTYKGFGSGVTVRSADSAQAPANLKNFVLLINPSSGTSCWKNAPLLKTGDVFIDENDSLIIHMERETSSVAKIRVKRFDGNESMMEFVKTIKTNCKFQK